ncbi:DNA translocase FtsK [Cytobacillus horneckiae]|uniref:DNA translocase FtsK n=1 Tax=Cytobacillus horneckiae TaxID=549687 RepID=A0A2N0ZAF5_9BACI|nr:DNA translocase FtsK [Cytobacillus horneckiae]MEC1154960.1 DNA translocase FtsK [Cytobacillus horneckiae]MED2936134.1 DNA translocase FtsK [Cytobacillus horneckiae]PKG26480.1 DNA translocase FtsK [Cytobacillus horneckiae]
MSWIKRLKNLFKNDDYEYDDEYIDTEEEVKQKQSYQKSEQSREVETRVIYQYPKGEFRFPIIPDEKKERDRSSIRQKKQNQEKIPASEKPEQRKQSVERKKPLENKPKEESQYTRNEREAKYRKGPFKPTEIPSPIYGYERPKIKKQIIEEEIEPVEYEIGRTEQEEGKVLQNYTEQETKIIYMRDEYGNESSYSGENSYRHDKKSDIGAAVEEQAVTLEKPSRGWDDKEAVFNKEAENKDDREHTLIFHEERKVTREIDEIAGVGTNEDSAHNVNVAEETEAELVFEEYQQQEEVVIKSPSEERESEGDFAEDRPKVQRFEEFIAASSTEEQENEEVIAESPSEERESEGDYAEDRPKVRKSEEFIAESSTEERENEEVIAESPSEERGMQEVLAWSPPEAQQQEEVSDVTRQPELILTEKNEEVQDEPFETVEEITGETERKSPEESSHSSRSHLPFNVMMLNSDKQKFNSNKRVEKTETKPQPLTMVTEHEKEEPLPHYVFPSRNLLTPPVVMEEDSAWLHRQEELLNSTLHDFNVRASVVNVTKGPAVTRFEVQPEPGVKVNKITNLSDDIKLSLAARDIRIEAPIPGKHTIGIEVPNQSSRPVLISEIINSPEFSNGASPLTAVLGLDIAGKPVVTDLRKMPHGLIAGATGSGKSVCINSILVSLLYKADPDELKLLLIDPKMVELAPYNHIPHLVSPVITDVKAATASLKWAVEEMERRYELFAHAGVRDINRYNEKAEESRQFANKLPFIVIVIDELADLMMMSPADVEEAICRIAQKARACGIHLIIATQRPSVDVITGLIKANVPTRVAFSVSSQIDSRTIIDISGAEKLLGRGDMLFLENGSSKPVRLQGTFVSDREIDDVVSHVRKERSPEFLFEQEELLKKAKITEEEDELFYDACKFVVDHQSASTSSLQRRFKIGYNRAARLIDMMEDQGFISENRGSKPRDVLITEAELESSHHTSNFE